MVSVQMRFMLLFSRQGKLRLQKWYTATAERDKKKMVRELMQIVLARKPKMCSFLEWRDLKIVYKRYHNNAEIINSLSVFKRLCYNSAASCK